MADGAKTAPDQGFECVKCGGAFRDAHNLRQHLGRKRPCAPILETEDLPAQEQNNPNRCRFCGRTFSRPDAIRRHQKQSCRILKEDAGLEILYDHVLRRSAAQLTIIAGLEAERAADQQRLVALEARLSTLAAAGGVTIDARVTNNIAIDTLNVTQINIFGREDTAHIPP
jgi:hypothetical protein